MLWRGTRRLKRKMQDEESGHTLECPFPEEFWLEVEEEKREQQILKAKRQILKEMQEQWLHADHHGGAAEAGRCCGRSDTAAEKGCSARAPIE